MGFAGHFDGIDRSLSVGLTGHFEWDYAVTFGGIKHFSPNCEISSFNSINSCAIFI